MSFPDSSLLPRGAKLKLKRAYPRYSLGDSPLPPFSAGDILTVHQDMGAGRLNVFSNRSRLSEIVYLREFDAEVISREPERAVCPV